MKKIRIIDDDKEVIISKGEYDKFKNKFDELSKEVANLKADNIVRIYKYQCFPITKSHDSTKDELLKIIKDICTFVETRSVPSDAEFVIYYNPNSISSLFANGDWDRITRIRTLQSLKRSIDAYNELYKEREIYEED